MTVADAVSLGIQFGPFVIALLSLVVALVCTILRIFVNVWPTFTRLHHGLDIR
ncbi:putative holin-like toxin [Alicyclobacillus acidocaldarius]|uniref:Uncharacterized protein n=1 Tax=Alicyclobacillus acidocaldarius (strain Tc-4-1) TaxID=1048834 RepID=F8ID30_ALIAT|nr:putative holin-like toxin [Alicyclobacillus acidocaldarius]AEJ45035.1 hypothetical protein TC41_3152 [Alicyclobacillus acidocaldarius subsp. acidocaldarius Tc-4-1]